MPSVAEKCLTFRKLHESGCFVIPNPWDIGSALYLQHLGFKAIASSSAGFAFSHGLADNTVPRDVMLCHLRELVEATDIPVNADFENGFAHGADPLMENVRLCVETGVAGLSIEDSTGDKEKPLYDFDHAVARISAARASIDDIGRDVILVARTEGFLVGSTDIKETIRRLEAFAEAGADCLYAPGIGKREDIAAIVKAVHPKPVNALINGPGGLTIADVTEIGVRRVSVGGALMRVAFGAFMRAARELVESGTFGGFAHAAPHGELNDFFRKANLESRKPEEE
jgi:2-methylisocitrate lyase-like PEP mutase family enzyme